MIVSSAWVVSVRQEEWKQVLEHLTSPAQQMLGYKHVSNPLKLLKNKLNYLQDQITGAVKYSNAALTEKRVFDD